MTGLELGGPAPDFTLRDQFGQDVSLSSYRDKKAVAILFYPYVAEPRRQYRHRKRTTYDTRADRLLDALGVSSTLLATTARLTRPTVHKFRRGKGTLRVSNLAAIVRALRQLTGIPVRAADLRDVGEADRQVNK